MKTTIEIPADVLKRTRATAALRGESLHEFVRAAIETRLALTSRPASERSGWRSVFGLVEPNIVKRIDTLLAEFEKIDPASWR